MPPSRRRMSRADRRSSSSTAMGMQDRSLAPGPTSSSFLVSGFATPRAMAPTLDASSITLASNYIRLDPLTAATQKLGAGQDMQGYFEGLVLKDQPSRRLRPLTNHCVLNCPEICGGSDAWIYCGANCVLNVKFHVGSMYALPLAYGSFDAVFANTLLQQLAEPSRALADCGQLLEAVHTGRD